MINVYGLVYACITLLKDSDDNQFFFKRLKWIILLPMDDLPSTRCTRAESQKINYNKSSKE